MLDILKTILTQQEGQGLTEYSLMLALVALAAFVAFETLGSAISAKLSDFANSYP
ncbi:MAG: Flp family type IVb pilin [Tepidanaerobacteraceae bacterium]|jgi:Flp pilus assembly pilin Flp